MCLVGRNQQDKDEEDKDSVDQDEQPSIMTNSELRSIDLNILGECYIPSSDIFSDQKDMDNNEEYEEYEVRQDEDEEREATSRNIELVNRRDKEGKKIDSLDSQKIDALLRRSIDNFIYETKDLSKPRQYEKGMIQKNNKGSFNNEFDQNQPPKQYNSQGNALPRSASQKYNYKRTPANDPESRYLHISPLNSGSKRSADKFSHKQAMHPTPPQTQQNFNVPPPRYASLMPVQHSAEQETYYNQPGMQGRQIQHYSFNAPRRSDQVPESYAHQISNSLNYPATHHMSLDENSMPSNLARMQVPFVNMPSGHKRPSPEYQYYEGEIELRPSSQRHVATVHKSPVIGSGHNTISSDKIYVKNRNKMLFQESRSVEYSPNSKQFSQGFNGKRKRQSNQTIEEEQESKSSKEENKDDTGLSTANKHMRNHTQVTSSIADEDMLGNDETVYTTNPANRSKRPNANSKSVHKHGKPSSATPQYDSFSHQFETISKMDSPEQLSGQMTFLCFNLYEILNRNKIPVKHNPDDSSQDMIIKIFESVAHDLRLKKERVENLENEDVEKSRSIEILTEKNDQLIKANQKLQKRLDEQAEEYSKTIQAHEQNFEDLQNTEFGEREKYKLEVERLKVRNRNLEIKFTQMEEEINDCREEVNVYKAQVQSLKHKLRQKEDMLLRNKLIKDKANASFELDNSNDDLINNSQYFNKRKNKKGAEGENHIHFGTDGMLRTEDSEDLSRAEPSAEKIRHRKIDVEKGEMFENTPKRNVNTDEIIEHSWFFKVLNELFAPYKVCDQNELLNIIREKYGRLLQSEELIQLKTQIEIILGLPKNCSKSIIINKIKDLRTSNMMSFKDSEVGVKIEDYEHVNKNFEAYEEMKTMFANIKSSLKLQNNATFTETLKAVTKLLSKKQSKDKIEKPKKPKGKLNPSRVALNKTKIDLAPTTGAMYKKTSPS